ncbi:hypothetical protein OQA88_9783 [Cercophora sp. LCS_1]
MKNWFTDGVLGHCRPHNAEEVYVTGTFDNWSKSEQLERVGDRFEKTVKLPNAAEKILYKFVVDGNWTTDHTAPQEKDHEGNENNVLFLKDMSTTIDDSGPAAAAIISSVAPESTTAQLAGAVVPEAKEEKSDFAAAVLNTVTPESTTAQLAGAVPLEEKKGDSVAAVIDTVSPESTTAQLAGSVQLEETKHAAPVISAVTPESTTAQLAGAVALEEKSDVSAPGAYPETPATELEKEIRISPLPAANGAVNPIQLAPGEKIPDEVTAGDINDNVTLDKESYEKSDRLPEAAAENVANPAVAAATGGDFGVSPLPAADGALNPVALAPGEKIPDEIKAGSTIDNVTLDKESYEKGDRLPGLDLEPGPVVSGTIEPEFSVKPLPATEGALNPIQLAPGDKIPDSVTAGSATDNVTLDKESYEKSDRLPGLDTEPGPIVGGTIEPEFSVKPLPATEGALNPIHLAPGEKIPDSVFAGSVADNVTLDKESYEKSDRIPGIDTDLPPVVSGNIIPESSLPIVSAGDVAINTVSPDATTAALAGQVPLEEPKVPEVVKKSQEEARVDPEASAIAEEVKEKAEVEEELLKKVPEVPPTSEGTVGKGADKSEGDKTLAETVAAVAATASAAVLGVAVAVQQTASATAKDAAAKLPESANGALPASLQPVVVPEPPKVAEVAAEVPVEVKESIHAAGQSAEAAANPIAVEVKKEVESQLLQGVEATKPVEEAPVAEEPKTEEPAGPVEVATNGAKSPVPETTTAAPVSTSTETAAETTKPADTTTTAEKKKRNRLSAFLSKIKHKVTDRDHK